MTACGWDVIDIVDGCFDIEGIVAALNKARAYTDRPTFINVRTIIGLGSAVAGDAVAHEAAFGAADVANMKTMYGFNPEEHFVIAESVRDFFADLPSRGQKLVKSWEKKLQEYNALHKLWDL